VNACLDYALDRIDRFLGHISEFKAHENASLTLVGMARTELAKSIALPPKKDSGQGGPPPSPTRRRRKSSGHNSPARQRSNTGGSAGGPRRRSSGGLVDESPQEAILRILALNLPRDTGEAVENSREEVEYLSKVMTDRSGKARDVARNAQQAFESSAKAQLADARLALQTLRDSILGETQFGTVRLVDSEIEGSIAVLSQEIEKAKTQVEAADISKTRTKSGRREELLKTWG
jgi:hypothetical protein